MHSTSLALPVLRRYASFYGVPHGKFDHIQEAAGEENSDAVV
jgi:hypothetical protein